MSPGCSPWYRQPPWWLVGFRAACVVVIPLVVVAGRPQAAAVLVIAALLSDIFDGVTARRTGTATPALRVADSRVDLAYWLSVMTTLAVNRWSLVREVRGWLLLVAVGVVLNALHDWSRFGRLGCYHAYTAKLACLLAAIAVAAAFAGDHAGAPARVAIAAMLVAQVDHALITALLPALAVDVSHVGAAWRRRTEALAPGP